MIRLSVKKRLLTHGAPFDLTIDLELASSELGCVFGPSGAGKSTLLRIIAGLMRPDSGRIEVEGETWFDSKTQVNLPPQKRKAGLIFQDYALFPNMTVRGNLAYAVPQGNDVEMIDSLLKSLRIQELADRYPSTLSGGQKQRVALARALASSPRILLLDEPLSALDPALRRELQDEIALLQKTYSIPTLLVTHDIQETIRLGHRVFCLERGALVKQGTPYEVFSIARMSNKMSLTGIVLGIRPAGVVHILSVLVGTEQVQVTSLPSDLVDIKVGDKVLLAVKAFNPMVLKMGSGA
jgi:molybdate transport system ATP-binding protein